MSSNRLSGLNVVLLAVTALALMFGAYGFITGGAEDSRPQVNHVAADPVEYQASQPRDLPPLRSTQRERTRQAPQDTQHSAREASDRATPNSSGPSASAAVPDFEIEIDSDPADVGEAGLSGRVIGPDGSGVAGATVTARRSDLELSPPQVRNGDIDLYREQVSEFLARMARESRATTSDTEGRFEFAGLDDSLAYDLTASSESGTGEQSRVAAGDSIVILISAESVLRGRVQNAAGEPVTEFTVRAWRPNRRWEATNLSFHDEEGRFSMPGRAGMMEVEVSAPGYTQDEPQEVQVGQDSEEVVITLKQAAVLSGVVTDKSGTPLGNVAVRVGSNNRNNNGRNRWNRGPSGPSTRTDSKGRYRFDSLKPEETTVTASRGEMSEAHEVNLTQGENTLDFQIDVGAIVRLRLTNPDGDPAEADQVWFQPAEGRGWPRAERLPAREPGLTEYAGLTPGKYTMSVTSSGFPVIRQEVELGDGDNEFKLQLSVGAMLTGQISSSSGSMIPNLSVRLRREGEQGWSRGAGSFSQVDSEGNYKLGPVEAGQWNLEIYATGGGNWRQVYTSVVTLTTGENSHDAVVDSGATVIVRVVDEEGNSVNWSRVQMRGEKNYNQRTDNAGTATISFVEVGTYTLTAFGRGLASRNEFISLSAGNNEYTVTVQSPNCCRLTNIRDGSQAANIGLQEGDLVVRYNGQDIASWRAFGQAVRATNPQDDVAITVERNGAMLTFNLKGGTVGVDGADAVR